MSETKTSAEQQLLLNRAKTSKAKWVFTEKSGKVHEAYSLSEYEAIRKKLVKK